ncbi:MAG: hypothetical protein JXB19_06510, partial [Bacteroidales bacterium]|nr:hypothetical protein [Bacteroidales bacterium]
GVTYGRISNIVSLLLKILQYFDLFHYLFMKTPNTLLLILLQQPVYLPANFLGEHSFIAVFVVILRCLNDIFYEHFISFAR